MKVAVIGAGFSGLAAVKYCKEANLSVDCFEQTSRIGGTWVYNENTGLDKNGLPIHSAMYRNLHTNLPKQTMEYQDFFFESFNRSYLTPSEVVDYMEKYVDHFGFRKNIKFEHLITKVEPLEDDKWRVTYKDLLINEQKSEVYDAIFVCNGHNFKPKPFIVQGIENFKGKIIHSHKYRVPEAFKGQKVLTIGAGHSGIDITKDLSSQADIVVFSHHGSVFTNPSKDSVFDSNVTQMPDVAEILDDGKVRFLNGEVIDFDSIVYCTGYEFTYDFLSPECKIRVEDNHVTELYKHVININHPTMFLIGIPFLTVVIPLFDLQVRFCLKFLTKGVPLPSTDQMRQDLNDDINKRQALGYKKRKMHLLGKDFMGSYVKELAEVAKIEPMKPVIIALCMRALHLMREDLRHYKEYHYEIVDDFNYVETRQD